MIFENFKYEEDEILIMINLIRNRNNISKAKIAKDLNIPYATFYRHDCESFKTRPSLIMDLKNLLGIERYDLKKLDYYSDEIFLNYLYEINVNLNIEYTNSICLIQNLIFRIIKSEFKDIEAYNDLKGIRNYLNNSHSIIYDLMTSIICKKEILISNYNKYLEIYTSYIKLKYLFKNNEFVEFLLIKDNVYKLLSKELMFKKIKELKLYELCVLFKFNKLSLDDLTPFSKFKEYQNEYYILKSILFIENNKIEDALYYILKIETIDKNCLLNYISKTTNYYINDIKKAKNDVKGSKIFSFLINNINYFKLN